MDTNGAILSVIAELRITSEERAIKIDALVIEVNRVNEELLTMAKMNHAKDQEIRELQLKDMVIDGRL